MSMCAGLACALAPRTTSQVVLAMRLSHTSRHILGRQNGWVSDFHAMFTVNTDNTHILICNTRHNNNRHRCEQTRLMAEPALKRKNDHNSHCDWMITKKAQTLTGYIPSWSPHEQEKGQELFALVAMRDAGNSREHMSHEHSTLFECDD